MKQVLIILSLAFLASAAPKLGTLKFRNLYKPGVSKIITGPRIIGGQEAVPHSVPHQVELILYSNDPEDFESGFCSGTLISANYILTAAHCGLDTDEAHVILGAHNLDLDEETTAAFITKEFYIHPKFRSDIPTIYDIATFKLPKAVTFTRFIKAVTLPKRSDASNLFVGDVARVSGWGYSTLENQHLSNVLRYVDVDIITNENCTSMFGVRIDDSVVCSSPYDNIAACSGDSGGPLAINGIQIGIVSFGNVKCILFPTAYTRVTSYLDWIQEHSDVVIQD